MAKPENKTLKLIRRAVAKREPQTLELPIDDTTTALFRVVPLAPEIYLDLFAPSRLKERERLQGKGNQVQNALYAVREISPFILGDPDTGELVFDSDEGRKLFAKMIEYPGTFQTLAPVTTDALNQVAAAFRGNRSRPHTPGMGVVQGTTRKRKSSKSTKAKRKTSRRKR